MAALEPMPVEVDLAAPADGEQVAGLLTDGAAWMAAKGCPAWSAAVLTEAFIGPLIARAEVWVARSGGEVVGVCTLSRADPVFWPEAPAGLAAYLHKLAVRRDFAGGGVTRPLIGHCAGLARDWNCSALRLDCHPVLRGLYERHGFRFVDTRRVDQGDGEIIVVDRLEMGL
jgi:GNAT superfamily N-acetyltransferase